MKIIAGAFRGRAIAAPPGRTARPTAARAREALFSMLSARDDVSLEDARIIDLFAGSGALGFEALSRGGSFCLFVETDAAARAAIRNTIEAFGLFGATRIHRRAADALGAKPAGVGAPFTLAFLDPPYDACLAAPAMAALAEGGWLSIGATAIVEQSAQETPVVCARFRESDRRRWGAAQIGIYRFAG